MVKPNVPAKKAVCYDKCMKRKWDVSSDAVRKQCIDEVITCLDQHSDESFGMIAAEEVIDVVLQRLGPDIYNLALKDTK
jgi:hypothetical protein